MSLPNTKFRQAHFVAHYARDSGGEDGVVCLSQTLKALCDLLRMHSQTNT